MSLDVLQQFESPSECWKIFRRCGEDLFSFIESNLQILRPNIFLDEKDYRKGDDDEKKKKKIVVENIKYQKGWHCFTNERDAREYIEYLFPERWHVCKIEVKQILAKGVIRDRKCVVVREIKINDPKFFPGGAIVG